MKHLVFLLALFTGIGGLVGCSRMPNPQPIEIPAKTPLTVAEWKELPIPEKYDPSSFERLKLQDPSLKNGQAWEKFKKEVIVPERKKDIPPQ